MSCKKFLIIAFLLMPFAAFAKPISYVGGTMVMQENDETGSTLQLDYTVTPKYAVGLYAKQDQGGKDFFTVGPQLNYLVKRWNFEHGQGNIFSMTGGGTSRYEGKENASAWTTILADYETRRVFYSYEARLMYVDTIEKSTWQRARVGFAPYLANYEDLNSWLMLQVDYHPKKNHSTVVTPLLRFFYKTNLIEVGVSNRSTAMFNWVSQF